MRGLVGRVMVLAGNKDPVQTTHLSSLAPFFGQARVDEEARIVVVVLYPRGCRVIVHAAETSRFGTNEQVTFHVEPEALGEVDLRLDQGAHHVGARADDVHLSHPFVSGWV